MVSCNKTIVPNNSSTKESDVRELLEQLPTLSLTDERRVLQGIADPNAQESDVLALMEQLRAALPTDDQAELWAQIANLDEYSDARRRRAVLLLFDRHVYSGMELSTVANLLANPTWLKEDNVHIVDVLAGLIPIDMVPGETVFVVIPEFSSLDKEGAVYLRVQGDPFVELNKLRDPHARSSLYNTVKDNAVESFYNALLGKKNEATALKITAVAVSPSILNKEDQRLFDLRLGAPGQELCVPPTTEKTD